MFDFPSNVNRIQEEIYIKGQTESPLKKRKKSEREELKWKKVILGLNLMNGPRERWEILMLSLCPDLRKEASISIILCERNGCGEGMECEGWTVALI